MNAEEIKYIRDQISRAQHMLGYNGGYGESSKILADLNKTLKKKLVEAGEERRVLRVN